MFSVANIVINLLENDSNFHQPYSLISDFYHLQSTTSLATASTLTMLSSNKNKTSHISNVIILMWIILAITVITINVVKHYNSSNKILSTNNKRKTIQQTEVQYLDADTTTTHPLSTNHTLKSIEVNLGYPLYLECDRESLPQDISLIWEKPGTSNDIIAIGSKIVSIKYRQRAKLINQHSTLVIYYSDFVDAGRYICSAAIPNEPPIIEYNVKVKTKHDLV